MTIFSNNDSGGECGVVAERLLRTPRASERQVWWSYDLGGVHILAMNTEMNFTRGSEQWRWIDDDLARVDRRATPWVLFGGHRPMYIDSNYEEVDVDSHGGDTEVMNKLIAEVEPLLVKHGVNLAFWGHVHVMQVRAATGFRSIDRSRGSRVCMFADARPTVASRRQRMCAVEKKKCAQRSVVNADGVAVYDRPTRPVHVVAGTAGANMYFNAEYDKEFTEKIDFVHGFGRATAHNATHLTWEFIMANGTDVDGQVIDSVLIVQEEPWRQGAGGGGGGGSGGPPSVGTIVLIAIGFFAFGLVVGLIEGWVRRRLRGPTKIPVTEVDLAVAQMR